ncbi:MAG TPA: 16S rRNA (adenine(1518)-N(6)/adenine(1519)-N(6))-dimethyltransferase RsmA [Actinomycetota bacterium]
MTPSAVRELAARHGIRPKKSLGQHFLIEPALARRIVQLAGVGPGDHVVEIGAGMGSLTSALAGSGASVVAVELDRALLPALQEVLGTRANVRVELADALRVNWRELLPGPGPWAMVANLPYNVAVPVVLRALELEPRIDRFLVMVQREVGERLAAGPGDPEYGAVSLRVAYRASAKVVRAVSPSVFWPRPNVESVLVSLVRRPPPVQADEAALWRLLSESFAQRRKTMRNALVRLGVPRDRAEGLLMEAGIVPATRPEELGLEDFARLARSLPRQVRNLHRP